MGKFLLILVLLFVFVSIFQKDEVSRHIANWRVRIDLSGFKLQTFSKEKLSGNVSKEELGAKRSETVVKITRTMLEDNKKYVTDRKFLLDGLFRPTTSPYPEVITNIIECEEEFKPKMQEIENGTIYTLFAGERFNYGVCVSDLVKYNSQYGIFDCGKKGVFEIRVFLPKTNSVEKLVDSFHC